jgi:hypothetical protein
MEEESSKKLEERGRETEGRDGIFAIVAFRCKIDMVEE